MAKQRTDDEEAEDGDAEELEGDEESEAFSMVSALNAFILSSGCDERRVAEYALGRGEK